MSDDPMPDWLSNANEVHRRDVFIALTERHISFKLAVARLVELGATPDEAEDYLLGDGDDD